MGDDIHALGRRAVAVLGWRWLPGMLALAADGPMLPIRLTNQPRPNWPDECDWPHDLGLRTPDLDDAETLAKLIDLVRSLYDGADQVEVRRALHPGQPYVRIDRGGSMAYIHGKTIPEALVRALENAAVEAAGKRADTARNPPRTFPG